MPITYKQFDRTSGKWVVKTKEITIIEGRRPARVVVNPEKKRNSAKEKVFGVFRANTKEALTIEEVQNKIIGLNSDYIRSIIYQLRRMGKIVLADSIINESGKRCKQFKIKTA